MKLYTRFFILLLLTAAVPAFAIEFGSVLDEEGVRILNSVMLGDIRQAPAPGGSNSSAGQTPPVNTVIQDASGASADPAASPPGNNANSSIVNPGSNAAPQGEPQETGPSLQPVPAVQEPSISDFRYAIQKYAADASQSGGTFNFQDQSAGKVRKLVLIRVNGTMEKGARGYSMDADFSDIETGELVNLKFELFVLNNQVNVIGIQMNTVNGQEPQQFFNNQLPQTP